MMRIFKENTPFFLPFGIINIKKVSLVNDKYISLESLERVGRSFQGSNHLGCSSARVRDARCTIGNSLLVNNIDRGSLLLSGWTEDTQCGSAALDTTGVALEKVKDKQSRLQAKGL
jgi:hypothetical protein